jgi:hypothetical protein
MPCDAKAATTSQSEYLNPTSRRQKYYGNSSIDKERVGGPLYNADARDHSRVAKNDWCAGEALKESNSGAKKYAVMSMESSSSRPAFRHCWMVSAP